MLPLRHCVLAISILSSLLVLSPITVAEPTLSITREIPTSEFVLGLRWSPSGEKLLARSGVTLKVLNVRDGTSMEFIEPNLWNADWGSNDRELIYTRLIGRQSEVRELNISTGERRVLFTGERSEALAFRRVSESLWTFAGPGQNVTSENRAISVTSDRSKELVSLGFSLKKGVSQHTPTNRERVIWETRLKDSRKLWYAVTGGAPVQIPWDQKIIAWTFPSDEHGLVAFKTFDGSSGSTVVIDLSGTIVSQVSMYFSPYDWHEDKALLLGYEAKDGLHDIVESAIAIHDPIDGSYYKLTDGHDLDSVPVWSPNEADIAFYRHKTNSIVVAQIGGIR